MTMFLFRCCLAEERVDGDREATLLAASSSKGRSGKPSSKGGKGARRSHRLGGQTKGRATYGTDNSASSNLVVCVPASPSGEAKGYQAVLLIAPCDTEGDRDLEDLACSSQDELSCVSSDRHLIRNRKDDALVVGHDNLNLRDSKDDVCDDWLEGNDVNIYGADECKCNVMHSTSEHRIALAEINGAVDTQREEIGVGRSDSKSNGSLGSSLTADKSDSGLDSCIVTVGSIELRADSLCDDYSAPQPDYSVSQADYPVPQADYFDSQADYSVPQADYSVLQADYSVYQADHSIPQAVESDGSGGNCSCELLPMDGIHLRDCQVSQTMVLSAQNLDTNVERNTLKMNSMKCQSSDLENSVALLAREDLQSNVLERASATLVEEVLSSAIKTIVDESGKLPHTSSTQELGIRLEIEICPDPGLDRNVAINLPRMQSNFDADPEDDKINPQDESIEELANSTVVQILTSVIEILFDESEKDCQQYVTDDENSTSVSDNAKASTFNHFSALLGLEDISEKIEHMSNDFDSIERLGAAFTDELLNSATKIINDDSMADSSKCGKGDQIATKVEQGLCISEKACDSQCSYFYKVADVSENALEANFMQNEVLNNIGTALVTEVLDCSLQVMTERLKENLDVNCLNNETTKSVTVESNATSENHESTCCHISYSHDGVTSQDVQLIQEDDVILEICTRFVEEILKISVERVNAQPLNEMGTCNEQMDTDPSTLDEKNSNLCCAHPNFDDGSEKMIKPSLSRDNMLDKMIGMMVEEIIENSLMAVCMPSVNDPREVNSKCSEDFIDNHFSPLICKSSISPVTDNVTASISTPSAVHQDESVVPDLHQPLLSLNASEQIAEQFSVNKSLNSEQISLRETLLLRVTTDADEESSVSCEETTCLRNDAVTDDITTSLLFDSGVDVQDSAASSTISEKTLIEKENLKSATMEAFLNATVMTVIAMAAADMQVKQDSSLVNRTLDERPASPCTDFDSSPAVSGSRLASTKTTSSMVENKCRNRSFSLADLDTNAQLPYKLTRSATISSSNAGALVKSVKRFRVTRILDDAVVIGPMDSGVKTKDSKGASCSDGFSLQNASQNNSKTSESSHHVPVEVAVHVDQQQQGEVLVSSDSCITSRRATCSAVFSQNLSDSLSCSNSESIATVKNFNKASKKSSVSARGGRLFEIQNVNCDGSTPFPGTTDTLTCTEFECENLSNNNPQCVHGFGISRFGASLRNSGHIDVDGSCCDNRNLRQTITDSANQNDGLFESNISQFFDTSIYRIDQASIKYHSMGPSVEPLDATAGRLTSDHQSTQKSDDECGYTFHSRSHKDGIQNEAGLLDEDEEEDSRFSAVQSKFKFQASISSSFEDSLALKDTQDVTPKMGRYCPYSESEHKTVDKSISEKFFSAYVLDLNSQTCSEHSNSGHVSEKDVDLAAAVSVQLLQQKLKRNELAVFYAGDCDYNGEFGSCAESEFAKPAAVRRSASLKTSPVSSMKLKKSVRFADALGLELTSIRTIRSQEDVPSILAHSSQLDSCSSTPNLSSSTDPVEQTLNCYYFLDFVLPSKRSDFDARVLQFKVLLETCSLDCEQHMVNGLVRVCNVAYQKHVSIRHTVNNWVTSHDTPATYADHCVDGLTDQFAFCLQLPRFMACECFVEFAVWYQAGDRFELKFWDNNGGGNYRIQCYNGQSDDSSWLGFV